MPPNVRGRASLAREGVGTSGPPARAVDEGVGGARALDHDFVSARRVE